METPTTVQLENGASYTIPTGEPGSWPWARQANLISVAYRQLGEGDLAAKWATEFDRRSAIYNGIQAGRDRAVVLAQFAQDLLTAPVKILQDIGGAVLTVGGSVVKTATTTLALLPIVVVGGLAALLILAKQGTLGSTIRSVRRR